MSNSELVTYLLKHIARIIIFKIIKITEQIHMNEYSMQYRIHNFTSGRVNKKR